MGYGNGWGWYYEVFGYSISGQLSKFKDLTGVSKNIDTNSVGLNINFGTGKVFLTNIGSSYSESGKSKVLSASLTNNIRIGTKIVMLLSSNYISRDDSEYNLKDNTLRINTELNYNLTRNMIFVLGTGIEDIKNEKDSSKNTSKISENLRFQINF